MTLLFFVSEKTFAEKTITINNTLQTEKNINQSDKTEKTDKKSNITPSEKEINTWKINNRVDKNNEAIDKNKTIKQLQNNIQELEINKKELHRNFRSFIDQHWELEEYFQKNISSHELDVIEEKIKKYNREKQKILHKKWKFYAEKLVEKKKQLYISFVKYIDINKVEGYKMIIIKDITILKKGDLIEKDISKKTEILDTKVTHIKKKISENQKKIQWKINIIIKNKITKKLEKYSENPKFQWLTFEKQRFIFQRVLTKVQRRITLLQNKEPTPQEAKKIKVYIVIEKVLEDFIWKMADMEL